MKKIVVTLLERLGFIHTVATRNIIKSHLEELLGVECDEFDDGSTYTLHPHGISESIVFTYVTADSMIRVTNVDIVEGV